MEQISMQAAARAAGNKGQARRLRAAGQVPAVVYGAGVEPQVIAVPAASLKKALAHAHSTNLLVNLELEGQGPISALLKSLEIDPIQHTPVSADFQIVSLSEAVTVSIAVSIEGEAAAGVTPDLLLHEVEVTCRPLDIPDQIVLDITGLGVHETRHASDLPLPAGVALVSDAEAPVVTGLPPAVQEEAGEETPAED